RPQARPPAYPARQPLGAGRQGHGDGCGSSGGAAHVSRIAEVLTACRGRGRTALCAYLTAGDPSLDLTPSLVRAAVDAGAGVVELGVPFSDPMADGPVLQRSAARAVAAGTTLPRILEAVVDLRRELRTPIVLFGYYNPFFRYGVEAISRDAAAAGVDGLL